MSPVRHISSERPIDLTRLVKHTCCRPTFGSRFEPSEGTAAAAEMLGFLLFHPEHTSLLVEAGYEDVGAQWPTIEKFFEKLERRPDKTVH